MGATMTETHPDWDGSFEDGMRCPHCGAVDEDRCDYPRSLRYDGDTTEVDCGFCGEGFHVTLCVIYEWATQPLFIGPRMNWSHVWEERRRRREQEQGDGA